MRNSLIYLAPVIALGCSSTTTTSGGQDGAGGANIGGAQTTTGGTRNGLSTVTSSGSSSAGESAIGGATASSTLSTMASVIGGTQAITGGTGGALTSSVPNATGSATSSGGVASSGTLLTGGTQTITGGTGDTLPSSGGFSAVGGVSGTGETSSVSGGVSSTVSASSGGTQVIGLGGSSGGDALTGGSLSAGGATTATGGSMSTGGTIPTGGSSGLTCTGQTKVCNGSCIPMTSCCGGCSGNTPVCSNGTCVGKPNGAACSTYSECASQVCADGVCCNVACDGQCEACNLSASAGTCTPTTTPRATNPCATDGSSCGGACDGTPEHRKACVYPSNSTLCGNGPSCSTTTNQATAGRYCNGSGLCPTAVVKNCAPYSCNGSVCATSCPTNKGVCGGTCVDIMSDATHCGGSCVNCSTTSSPRCYSGACVECNQASDCNSLGFGAGAFCNNNHTCQCRQPSSGNLIQNPGVDSSLSGWDEVNTTTVSWDSSYDSLTCSRSGAVRLSHSGFVVAGTMKQCLPVQPDTTYYFGFAYRQAGTASPAVYCSLDQYTLSGCGGTLLGEFFMLSGESPSTNSWSYPHMSFRTSTSTRSLSLLCGNQTNVDAWMDSFYLNTTDSF